MSATGSPITRFSSSKVVQSPSTHSRLSNGTEMGICLMGTVGEAVPAL